MRAWYCGVGALLAVLCLACGASPPPGSSTAAADGTDEAGPRGPSIVVTEEMGHPHVGDAAPDFELTDAEGNPVRLSSLQGEPVVLSFAASWCPFSTAAQPQLAELATEYADRGVHVLVVGIEEGDEGFQTYLERVEMPMPVLRDAAAAVTGAYVPPQAQPNIERDRWKVIVSANLVIDREGIIRFFTLADTMHYDAEFNHVRAALDDLLAASASAPATEATP
ncbi:MAG: TlpA family protein disulfide reductase [Deltaproteobacteria bacterium]|nr:TlpA family protein disulfide reductase [Deltaproteobacteria bacterium]